jgi:hypothetical protein
LEHNHYLHFRPTLEIRMPTVDASPLTTASLGATDRRDKWWGPPTLTGIVLIIFGAYSMWAAFQGNFYEWGPYLSPLYSPVFKPSWLPVWVSPAFLILGAPLGFRATCYYYRKAYYRSFFFDPPACAVGEGKGGNYSGERAFPFILQNLHRFFLYLALIFIIILGWDSIKAFMFTDATGITHFGMGVGTLVLLVNWLLLSGYTFGCHSLRHLLGGKIDCFSCHALGKQRYTAWKGVSWFNGFHMNFAWASLIWVGFSDLYIRLVAMGIWHDFRFF